MAKGLPLPVTAIAAVIQKMPGRFQGFMEYARMSEDPDVIKVCDLFYAPGQKKNDGYTIKYKFTRLCTQAEVSPTAIFRAVVDEIEKVNKEVGRFVLSVKHPSVVDASVRHALKPKGTLDRKMLHQAAGFIPVPRGHTISIRTNVAAQAAAQAFTTTGEPSDLPSFEDSAIRDIRLIRGDEDQR